MADRSGAGSRVDTDSLREYIDRDGRLMLAAAERAGWNAPVPGLEWDVRTVVAHTAAVHRWAADIVGRALPTNETGGSAAFLEADMSDARLMSWADEARVLLIRSLSDAPAELRCYTFTTADSARHFWTRRQAHETAVHRMDVEAAGGAVTPVDADFA